MSTNQSNTVLIDRLFKAGAHFGFKKSRRHPSMKPFLFGTKEGNDVFDLERSATLLAEAKEVVKRFGSEGKTILFVGTKEEISSLVRESAEKVGAPFVTNRWVGGMITNWSEIRKRIGRLFDLIAMGESGELERKYTKKERVIIGREQAKLVHNFGGIRAIEKQPDLMIVVDPRHDKIAVAEAAEKNIPTIGIMSSDNDVKKVTYPIVINDTLRPSVSLALDELTAAYTEGKQSFTPVAADTVRRRRALQQ
jgi:small subunit ribosomal protein S2